MQPPPCRAWIHFRAVVRPFFRSEERWAAGARFGLLLALLLASSGLNVLNSYVNRDLMTSLAEGRAAAFWTIAVAQAAVCVILAATTATLRFTEDRLAVRLREGLTRHLLSVYPEDGLRGAGIDNPDQRIAEEVKTFATQTLSFALILLTNLLNLIAFTGVLWSITPHLLTAAVGYAAAGTAASVLLGRRLVGLQFQQLKREADFRRALIEVAGHDRRAGRGDLGSWLAEVVANARRMIAVQRNLAVFTNAFDGLKAVLPALVVAPLYFAGQVGFGAVPQAVIAFGFVLNAFAVVVGQFLQVTGYAAAVERLGALAVAVGADEPPRPLPHPERVMA